jgi:hypothetical protein
LQQERLGSPFETARATLGESTCAPSRQGWAWLWFTALSALLLLWCLAPASAQISPGALSRAHQSLNGATNCTTCHKLAAGAATFKCADCHTEIASRIAARRGLHASYNLKPGSSQECARCHSEHNGEDFPLVKWDTKTFDHKQTGYALEGKHAGLVCTRCHTAEHVSAAERPVIKIKDFSRTFLGVSPNCVTCHQDQHNGRLGANCLQCHTYNDWKTVDVGQFDHSKTRYPLTGLHAPVTCQKCHTPGPDNKPRYTGIAFGNCSDCHSDPHRGSFAQTCQSCHNTGGWKKVSTTAVNERFDHSKTKYPLLGKHETVNCSQCHAAGDFKKPLAFQKCMDCHKPDPHSGQFAKRPDGVECASCHTVDGFKPSKFTVKDHAATAYPLEAGHAKLQCAQCHIPKGKETLFKIKFQHCTDCHSDQHAGQFAAAPYLNACERCHNLQGYRPSTFTLARHKETHFVLTGGHVAVPCGDCHKESTDFKPKPAALYHWNNLSCTSCHADPHKGQFKERMQQARAGGAAAGCQACHSTKSWKELSGFDHSQTSFPLVGAHRATACMECHKPPNLETRLINVDFKAAPAKCEECHQDIHGRQFAKNGITPCVECHNSMKWKPSLFDHDKRTSFPLEGLHRNVRCEGCHKQTQLVEGKKVLFYKPTPKECAACHGPTTGVPQKATLIDWWSADRAFRVLTASSFLNASSIA